jgi:hypothetical protein
MTTTIGRLDADITVPTGGWDLSYTDSAGGPLTANIAAGTYLPNELVSAVQAAVIALAGAVGATFTATISDGESGTGLVTLNATATPWSISWTDTDLRDALGFAGNITAVSASQTGTKCAVGLWLPGNPAMFSMYGSGSAGTRVTDYAATVGPTGRVHALMGNQYVQHVGVRWDGVPSHRALAHFETITGESFESFVRDVMTNRKSYVSINPLIRLTWSADVDATYAEGRVLWPAVFDLEAMVTGWTGRWNVRLPPLVIET